MSNITNLNRDYLIKINVKEATIDVPKMTFWNTDKKTSNMFVQLVINMSTNELISQYVTVQNATDYKITLNVIKPKTNQYRTIEATLLNEEKALFEIDLPDEFTDQVGDYSFEFEVSSKVDSNDESITTSNGIYKVNGSILTNLNEETSSSPDLPILKQLIEQVKSLQGGDLTGYQKKSDNSLETTSKEVVGAINEVNSQFKDIAKKIDDIGTGGSGLNLRNIQNGEIFVLKTSTTKIPVTGVSLNKSTLNLNVGDTEILIPTITPDNATSSTIIWSCDNNNAKVEGGVVTALKAGTCVITATSDDTTNGTIKATCSVICSNVNVQNVSISGDTEVTTSTSITLSANITPGNATNKNVTWSKNNDNINITPNGLQCDVIGVSEGSSVITVTTEDGNKTATYNITVSTGIVAPSDCDIDSTNLQGYYRMNHLNEDNTKILDISGNGRDMTIYPNNMTIGEGYYTKVNQYQHLNNSQYSAHDSGCDQFKNVFNDNNVTLFLTVYIPSSVGGAEALFGLEAVDGFGGCTFQGGVIIYNQDQQTFNQVQSSTKSCLGSLCTLAFKHDAVNNKDYIYKDGVLLNEQDSKVDLVNGKVAEYLGIGRGYTTSYGNIKFYNWAIYNAVLNNDKIQEISTTLLTNAGGGN